MNTVLKLFICIFTLPVANDVHDQEKIATDSDYFEKIRNEKSIYQRNI
jgi:hypothetical protein